MNKLKILEGKFDKLPWQTLSDDITQKICITLNEEMKNFRIDFIKKEIISVEETKKVILNC